MSTEIPKQRVLVTLTAKSRYELQRHVDPIGMTVRGYGTKNGHSLASINLRSKPDAPALLNLRRDEQNEHQFLVELTWLGEEPELPTGYLRQIELLKTLA